MHSQTGGRQAGGSKAVSSLKPLRSAVFNNLREHVIDNPRIITMRDQGAHVYNEGAFSTESVGNAQFTKGLRSRMGTRGIKAWPMPSEIARQIEAELLQRYTAADGIWPKYYYAAAICAHVELYTALLRGNEPWLQKTEPVAKAQYFDANLCSDCGEEHVGIVVNERTKTEDRGFDCCIAPITGARLHAKDAMKRLLRHRRQLPITSPWLFVLHSGKAWNNTHHMKIFVEPLLKQFCTQGHPGMTKVEMVNGRWAQPQEMTIRIYRRGGDTFLMNYCGIAGDLLNLMGRWRPEHANSEPGEQRLRYAVGNVEGEPVPCSVLVRITSTRPVQKGKGRAAQWS